MDALESGVDRVGIDPNDSAVRARLACEGLIVTAFRWADEGRRADVADLFVEGGSIGMAGHWVEGREGIRAALAVRDNKQVGRRTQHVVNNIEFRLEGAGRARARAVMTLYVLSAPNGAQLVPAAMTSWDDEFALGNDGRWRFTRRESTPIFGAI